MRKAPIWIGLLLGSFVGWWIVRALGADGFSFWPFLGSLVGAVGGIFGGYKISQMLS